MNEIQTYSTIMFFAGVLVSQAIFYFDKKSKKRKFYLYLSATILQVLDNISLVSQGAIIFAQEQLKNLEDLEKQEYLKQEQQKLTAFMELYVLLFIKAVPIEGRKFITFKSWSEAEALIKQMRGFLENEKGKGQTLEN